VGGKEFQNVATQPKVAPPSIEEVVAKWAEVCLNTDELPSMDKVHPIAWVKGRLPMLVDALRKAGYGA
jgi:hypothetical protein